MGIFARSLSCVLGLISLTSLAAGQSVNLTLGSASGNPGSSVSVPITITGSGGAQTAGLQWSFSYPGGVTGVTVVAGSSALTAGKLVSCSFNNCIVYGFNNATITDGVVATATFQISPGATGGPISVQLTNLIASDPAGLSLPVTGTAGSIAVNAVAGPAQLSSLTCSPSSIGSSTSTICTASLDKAATLPAVISISSNNLLLTAPASVTIGTGQTSTTFNAASGVIPSAQSATLLASHSGVSRSAVISLTAAQVPAQLTGFTCTPTTVSSNSSTTCTVTLDKAALSAATISLSSNNSLLTAPASVTIGTGQTGTTFTAASGVIPSTQSATLLASYGGVTKAAIISLAASPQLSGLTCMASTIATPGGTTCTVTITQSALAAGFPVTLSSNNPSLTVPASVAIGAGQTSASFGVNAAAVATDQTVTLNAAAASGALLSIALNLTAPPQLSSLSCAASALGGGTSTTCTVALTRAGAAIVVSVASDNVLVTVPVTVTVPASQISVSFQATVGTIPTAQSATLTAAYGTVTRTATLSLTAPARVTMLTCENLTIVTPGTTGCTVSINQAASTGGFAVALGSGNANLTVPASVTVAAGQTTAPFTATALQVSVTQSGVLTATGGGGSVSVTLSLTEAPVPQLSSLTCAASSIQTPGNTTCTVSITLPAATGGFTVSLGSSSGGLNVPGSVSIPGTQSSTTFLAGAAQVNANENVVLTASGGGASRTFVMTLLPVQCLGECASSSGNLSGSFNFRQVLLVGNAADVTETRSASGTLVFDGAGNFTFTGQQLVNQTPAAALSGSGTYTIKTTGVVTLTNPVRTSATLNARLGVGALVGSSTEAGPNVYDLFIAIPAPSGSGQAPSNALLSGAYSVSSLEFPGGGLNSIRNTNTKLTANGAGAFNETVVSGRARNQGGLLRDESVGLITYSVSPSASGVVNFPSGNATQRLIEGSKSIYVSPAGDYFIGGSLDTGGHGLIAGVKAFAGDARQDSWNGFFQTAGLSFDAFNTKLSASAGSLNVVQQAAVWANRTRQSDGAIDTAVSYPYTLDRNGIGQFTDAPAQVNLASTGKAFSSTGMTPYSSTYGLSFGTRMPPMAGSGVFIDPQRVVNAANYGLGYPLAPGGFFSIFGTGLASQTGASQSLPFPKTLFGVSVTVNGLPVPLYYVSPTLISGVVPFTASGNRATVVVKSDGATSNIVEVPLSPTAPGIFTLTQNGLGAGATLHADYSVVTQANPARAGEIVQVFVAGLGAVSPSVPDGDPAPSTEPLSRVLSNVTVTVGGLPATVHYKGLAPTWAGLYQLNIELPLLLPPGKHRLAIKTGESLTDMAVIDVGF